MVEGKNYELQSFKKAHASDADSTPANRTQKLIDQFLHTTQLADDGHGRRIIVADATSDYTAFLQEMEDIAPAGPPEGAPTERSTELIDSYIENKPQRIVLSEELEFIPDIPEEQDETIDEGFFTEALAKIYIKQGRYEKALEIIRKLNLNYPKKNSYFADQIRFLQKLIINNKTKK
jgi:tetratricopeptide (TPR) repeat protein